MSLPEIVMVPLNKIKDNPWRDKKLNPIDPERVEALVESIDTTGEFWVGVYGRRMPDGTVQIAFGHHRADAAKIVSTKGLAKAARMAGLKEIPVTIREFTDHEMLMWMTRENLRGDLPVVLEAVSAAVQALAQGKIEIPAPDPKTRKDVIMYAPSFAPGSSASEADHAYTASTLAKFLGRMYCKENKGNIEQQNSVKAALGSLELIERKVPGYSLASTKNISLVKLIKANSEIKDKHERAQARQKKTAEELTKKNEEIAENTRKADEAEVELKQAKLAQKKAEREVKKASTKAKAKRLRKKASEARDKAERNKENIEEHGEKLEEDVAKVHAKEEEQKAEDEYEAIRRSMRDRIRAIQMIGKDEHEDKSLGVRDLKEKDREIVRQEWLSAGNRCQDRALYYVPPVRGKEELIEMQKREDAKHHSEKESQ